MERVAWYRGIRFRVQAMITVIVLIPMIIFWNYATAVNRDTALKQYEENLHAGLYGASLMMQATMNDVSDFSREISQDQELVELVEEYQRLWFSGEDRQKVRSRICLYLNERVSQQRSLESIYLYFTESRSLVTTIPEKKEMTEEDSFSRILYRYYYDILESPLEWRCLPTPSGQETLSMIRPLNRKNGYCTCILICNLKNSAWENNLHMLEQPYEEFYIADYSGRILIARGPEAESGRYINYKKIFDQAFEGTGGSGMYSQKIDGDTNYIGWYDALESGWKYMIRIPEAAVLPARHLSAEFYGLIFLCGLLSIGLGTIFLHGSVIRPIGILSSYMNASKGGHMEKAPEIATGDELMLLFSSYNNMIDRQEELMNQVNIHQLLRKQTQLNYLQSQMDEHFLFNTLNTIYSEACHEQAQGSARMILILSKYFRLSLSYGKEKLPLNQIAELLSLYLKLQCMRFGTALSCQVETFPEMGDYVALKYLFQPIVENALVHGFEKKVDGHQIRILFRKEEGELYFEVEDDGIGIPPEKLSALREEINSGRPVEGEGFALKNIREQLCITYGERNIQMESEYGKGTRVYFRIPLERRSGDE